MSTDIIFQYAIVSFEIYRHTHHCYLVMASPPAGKTAFIVVMPSPPAGKTAFMGLKTLPRPTHIQAKKIRKEEKGRKRDTALWKAGNYNAANLSAVQS